MPNDPGRVWTIRELMKFAIQHLQARGIEEARLNTELLLAHALKLQRIQLYLNFEKPLNVEELKNFRFLLERRLKHEPVQYIIGSTNFMGLQFNVDANVLIPRPETETLIERVIELVNDFTKNKPIKILDIGTGSGNIAISIVKYIKQADVVAVDISESAIEVAQRNAVMHNVNSRIEFYRADIYNLPERLKAIKFDIVVSNPPYIPKDEWEQLRSEIRDHEPSHALTDGKNGLSFYKQIIQIIPTLLKPNGIIVFEVGYGQLDQIINELKAGGFNDFHISNDMQDMPRVISGIWGKPSFGIITTN
jgi:release factor glutamine methyltransferase